MSLLWERVVKAIVVVVWTVILPYRSVARGGDAQQNVLLASIREADSRSAGRGLPARDDLRENPGFRNAEPSVKAWSEFPSLSEREAGEIRPAKPSAELAHEMLEENPPIPNSESGEESPASTTPEFRSSEGVLAPYVPPFNPGASPSSNDEETYPGPVEKLPEDAASSEEQQSMEESQSLKPKPPFPASPWDLANLQSPLFGTEEVTELSQPQRVNTKGLWNFRPHLSITTLYDGNVFIQQQNQQSDFIVTVSPGVGFQIGNDQTGFSLAADYTASAVLFLSENSQDSLDHRGNLSLQWSGAKLRLGLQLGFAADSGTNIDASDRVKRLAVYSGVTAHYEYSPKLSFDANASYRPTSYENLIGSNEARLQGYVNYNLTPKVTLGLGGSLGLTTVESSGDQTSEEPSVRATYAATEKVTFTANGGVEFRQLGRGGGNTVTPVFGLDAAWSIREGTSLTLTARRRIFSSAVLKEQNYTDTGFSATVQQRMTDRFTLSLSLGYDNLAYTSAGAGVNASREDSFFYVRPSIQCHIVSWCSVGLFYEYSQNFSSGESARSFQRDRAGLQVNLTY